MIFWILLVAYLLVTAGIASEARGAVTGWAWLVIPFWPLALMYRLGQKVA